MRNYIILNGVNSNTITGLLISKLPPITKPKIRTQTEEIDGRDGDIVTKLGYSAYDKIIEIGLYGNFDINEVISYFSTEGTVVFSNEADKYYNYQILDQIDYEKLIRFKTAKVKMHVQPFKYPLQEEQIQVDATVVQASGTDIRLEYTTPNASIETEVEGKSEQDSYSGKNKFDYKSASNVNNTVVSTYRLFEINGLKPNTQYNINRMGFTEKLNNQYCYLWDKNVYASANRLSLCTPAYLYNKRDFISNSEGKMYLAISPTDTNVWQELIPFFENVQIEEGSSETSYEPYVGGTPSPNPDYPQEIKSVSGIGNLFDESQLLSANDWSKNSNGYYNGTFVNLYNKFGTSTNGFNFIETFKNNTPYTISFNAYVSTGTAIVRFYYTDNTQLNINISATSTTKYKTTTDSNKTISKIVATYSTGQDNILYIKNIQLVEGSIENEKVPYGHWLPVKVSNKNLFDINGNVNVNGRDGSQTTYNSVSDGILTTNSNTASTHAIGQKYTDLNGKTITFSADVVSVGTSSSSPPRVRIAIYDNGTMATRTEGVVGDRLTITYICTSDNIVCGFATVNGTGGQYKNIQVEINNEETDYVEHQEQTTLIDLNKYDENNSIVGNYEICSIGDTKDLLTIKNGKAVINKNISNIVLNGSNDENWGYSSSNDLFVSDAIRNIAEHNNEMYCSHFRIVPFSTSYGNMPNGTMRQDNNSSRLIVKYTDYTTADAFKTWLSTHNTEVYYVLATPEEIELNGDYNIKAYDQVTYMTTEGNLIPVINAKTNGMPNTIVTNIGNIYAKPLITIYGSGDIGVYLNNQHVLQIALGDNESITIDVSKMEAYDKNTKVLMNRLVTGDYMKFLINSGENEIAFSGTVAGFTMDNYTRWL